MHITPSTIRLSQITGSDVDRVLSEVENVLSNAIGPKDPAPQSLRKCLYPKFKKDIHFLLDALVVNKSRAPLLNILKISRRRYNCFILVEEPYLDLEEWSSYSAFYSKTFTPYDRNCRRLHFFDGPDVAGEELRNHLTQGIAGGHFKAVLAELKLAYRGFMLVRPGTNVVVGRSIIEFADDGKSPSHDLPLHELEKKGVPYCTASLETSIHLCATKVTISGVPFIQQNPVVGVCATASVWVASQILAEHFGMRKYPFSTITKQAERNYSVSDLEQHHVKFGRGLNHVQIMDALSHTGAAPIFAPIVNTAFTRLLCYTYVESRLPVIAGYITQDGGHAVTLVGHLLPNEDTGEVDFVKAKDAKLPEEDTKLDEEDAKLHEGDAKLVYDKRINGDLHYCVGQCVRLYYAHNDNYGPYDRVELLPNKRVNCFRTLAKREDKSRHLADATCIVSRGRENNDFNKLEFMVVGLPPYVQSNPDEIMVAAMRSYEQNYTINHDFKVLWRFLLVYTPHFKDSILTRDYPDELKHTYSVLHLPLYVWLAEYTIAKKDDPLPLTGSRKVHGELLYDSTTPSYEPTCLSARFANSFKDFSLPSNTLKVPNESVQNIGCFTHPNGGTAG